MERTLKRGYGRIKRILCEYVSNIIEFYEIVILGPIGGAHLQTRLLKFDIIKQHGIKNNIIKGYTS